MKPLAPALTTMLLAAAGATAPIAPPAQAGALQQCRGNDGSLLYTDRDCASFGARAVPMRGELSTRIASEERQEERRQEQRAAEALATMELATSDLPFADEVLAPGAGTNMQAGVAGASMPATSRPGRRSVLGGCARTQQQLAFDLQAAYVLGDVNRVAESYHWVGMDHESGHRILNRLRDLGQRPILSSRYYGAQIAFASVDGSGAWPDASTAADAGGIVQLVFGDGDSSSIVEFKVERYADCYFVRF